MIANWRILSRFCYLISIAEVHADGRIIYGIVVTCLGIIQSILFCPPFEDIFLAFPFDLVMFVMWLLAYCLLQTTIGSHVCSARWYCNYRGYYWGRFWRFRRMGTVTINGAGCGPWKTVPAFSCIAWFFHLLGGILGIYVFRTYIKLDETKREINLASTYYLEQSETLQRIWLLHFVLKLLWLIEYSI
ncbi:hypothetical protein QL093DRAFT_2639448 [Fusarium oxysporum]|nr:hypothetical protein QL093DRAFT_2639448 [Fusarium oxysporum]